MKITAFEFNFFGVRTYVVWNERTLEAAIIDPGMMNHDERQRLTDYVSSRGLKVQHLVNTHLHIDHAMADNFIADTYGVDVEAHPDDAPLGAALADQARMFHLPIENPGPVAIGRELTEGSRIHLGDEYLEVLHVPGHSPGSIALYAPSVDTLISGDTLFHESVGRTDLKGGNPDDLLKSLKRLLNLPEKTLVLPGHGEKTSIAHERKYNPWARYCAG